MTVKLFLLIKVTLNLFSEGRTGGQPRWTRGSLGEAVRTRRARDTGETPAGVQANGGGVVREAKTETLGEKERGEQKQWQLTPASQSGSCSHFLWELSAEVENVWSSQKARLTSCAVWQVSGMRLLILNRTYCEITNCDPDFRIYWHFWKVAFSAACLQRCNSTV